VINACYHNEELQLRELLCACIPRTHEQQTSKKLSKDAKKEQRRVFRELHAAITEGAPPSQELALQNGALTATTWAEVRVERYNQY
jgi:hypothetical protein